LTEVRPFSATDVIFFDESIDAKLNRYTFRMHNIDTPFLLNNAHKHTKNYVAPSPDISNLTAPSSFPSSSVDELFQSVGRENAEVHSAQVFPRLNAQLFSPPRCVKIPFEPSSAFNIGWSSDRLKRMASIAVTPSVQDNAASHETAGSGRQLTAMSCFFSVYLALLSHSITFMGSRRSKHPQIAAVGALTSTVRLLDEFGTGSVNGDDITPDKTRRRSSIDLSNQSPMVTAISFDEDAEVAQTRAAAMSLGLKVSQRLYPCFDLNNRLIDRLLWNH
jgi:hypothetical protein